MQPVVSTKDLEHADTMAAGVRGGDSLIRVTQTEQDKPDVSPVSGRRHRKVRC